MTEDKLRELLAEAVEQRAAGYGLMQGVIPDAYDALFEAGPSLLVELSTLRAEVSRLVSRNAELEQALREAEHTIEAFAPKRWWRQHPRKAAIDALLASPVEPQP